LKLETRLFAGENAAKTIAFNVRRLKMQLWKISNSLLCYCLIEGFILWGF